MAERLSPRPSESSGISRGKLRIWAYIFLTLGAVSVAVLQNGLLKMPSMRNNEELFAFLEANPKGMAYATLALVLQIVGSCAAPLFAFLLAQGVERTAHFGKYFLRVLAVAVVSELPYNLAVSGRWIYTESRNPAFGLVLAMVALFLFKQYNQGTALSFVLRAVVAVAGILWAGMLGVQDGAPLVLLTLVLWLFREKKGLWMVFGCLAALLCTLFSLFYLLSPMAFILLHLYNGEKGEENVLLKHVAYPVILLSLGIVATYVI